jgi:hypothetical protein
MIIENNYKKLKVIMQGNSREINPSLKSRNTTVMPGDIQQLLFQLIILLTV